MKVNILKDHPFYGKGVVEVEDGRGEYLIRVGVAEAVKGKAKFEGPALVGSGAPEIVTLPEEKEKVETKEVKEKVEQKQGKEKVNRKK